MIYASKEVLITSLGQFVEQENSPVVGAAGQEEAVGRQVGGGPAQSVMLTGEKRGSVR